MRLLIAKDLYTTSKIQRNSEVRNNITFIQVINTTNSLYRFLVGISIFQPLTFDNPPVTQRKNITRTDITNEICFITESITVPLKPKDPHKIYICMLDIDFEAFLCSDFQDHYEGILDYKSKQLISNFRTTPLKKFPTEKSSQKYFPNTATNTSDQISIEKSIIDQNTAYKIRIKTSLFHKQNFTKVVNRTNIEIIVRKKYNKN